MQTVIHTLEDFATDRASYRAHRLYVTTPDHAAELFRAGLAKPTRDFPEYVRQLLDRVHAADGRPAIFTPNAGSEFGHEIMNRVRWVHASNATHKVVCCRPGCEALYPSAHEFITDWVDPVPDRDRVGSPRDREFDWTSITDRYPDHLPISTAGLTLEMEEWAIDPEMRITFTPRRRGLVADVVLGIRKRDCAPARNWQHWQTIADVARAAGLTVGVVGHLETSAHVRGELFHAGEFGDADAQIEAMQACRLYIGTDSGISHLAATVGARMNIFRKADGSRDFTGRMQQINPGKVQIIAGGWDHPGRVVAALALDALA